jgi:predicted PurR-regulated permease PerM
MNEPPLDFSEHAQRVLGLVLTGLFVLAGLYTLYFARAVLIPVVLAVILSWILSPAVRGLKRRLRLPAPWGAALVIGVLVAALGYGVGSLTQPAKEWVDKAPGMLRQMEIKVREIRESVQEVSEITEKAEQIAGQDGAGKVALAPASLFSRTLTATPAFLVSVISTLILAHLLLAYGGTLMNRFIRMLPTAEDKRAAIEIVRSFQRDIARYLFLITVLSVALGAVTGLALYWLGMPNPVLWAVVIAVLNYVPYLGAALSLIILTPVAILSIEPLGQALLVPGVFLVLNIIEGELLTAIVVGKYFTLNPVIVFLSILFWGWLWGVVGALVAVPLLVSFRIFCAYVPALRPLCDLIGDGTACRETEGRRRRDHRRPT